MSSFVFLCMYRLHKFGDVPFGSSLTVNCADIVCYLHTLSQVAAIKSRVELLAKKLTSAALPTKPHLPAQPTPEKQKPRLFSMEVARDMAIRMKALAQCN